MNYKSILFIAILIISINLVLAEEIINNEITPPIDGLDQNLETNVTNVTEQVIPIEDISLKNFIPKEFKLGDAQFSIQVQNNKPDRIDNIMAFVSGKGFSTYDITPIDYLEPGEKGYILVNGNFKEPGLIELTIKINQYTFLQNITILGESQKDKERAEELLKQEEEKKKILADLSIKLDTLKQNYTDLENILAEKEKENYDIKPLSGNLGDLKKYIKNAEAGILGENVEDVKINVGLAFEEYKDIEPKLNELKKLPKITKIKEYAIIFSAIAGAIITFFALYELLKKKGTAVASTITTIKQKTETKDGMKTIEIKEEKQEPKKEETKKEHKRKKKK